MSILSPSQKREHFFNSRKAKLTPARFCPAEKVTCHGIELMLRFARDELLTAMRLSRAEGGLANSITFYASGFPERARELRKLKSEKRRLMWYSLASALREFGCAMAAALDEVPLTPDEVGVDVDVDSRRLAAWLVDVGLDTLEKRRSR